LAWKNAWTMHVIIPHCLAFGYIELNRVM
jgi:hypothetical protein